MVRSDITRKRASMILLVFLTVVYFSDLIPNKFPFNVSIIFFGAAWIISIIYWISGEIEWREVNSNKSNSIQTNIPIKNNEKTRSPFSKTIGTIAAIGTIITTIIIMLRECS